MVKWALTSTETAGGHSNLRFAMASQISRNGVQGPSTSYSPFQPLTTQDESLCNTSPSYQGLR
jgi:hypothetical protein